VESVTFDLHDSFNDPQRIVTSPPFLIEEEGYGSFDIQITLKFKDSNINSFHFLHRLVVTKPKSSDLLTINLNSGFGNCIEMLYGYDVDLLERKLNLLGGRDILHAAQIVKDMRDDGCWVDESIEGEFHFDLYSLRKEIIDTLWNFVKNK
jgi:transcription initiation factor IIF auxiliary subunit